MVQPYGALGHFAISRQSSFGTAAASWMWVPIMSESIVTAKPPIRLATLQGRLSENEVMEGPEEISGDVTFDVDPFTVGHFLHAVMGQPTSPTAVASGIISHAFQPSTVDFSVLCPLPPATLQVERDSSLAWHFSDCIFTRFELVIAQNAPVQMTVSMLSKITSLGTATGPSFYAFDPFMFNECSLQLAASANAEMEELRISFEQPCEAVWTVSPSRRLNHFRRTALQMGRVSGRFTFATQSQYAAFLAQSEQALELEIHKSAVTSADLLNIKLPAIRFEGMPVTMGGPGPITADFTADAKYHPGSDLAMDITLANSFEQY